MHNYLSLYKERIGCRADPLFMLTEYNNVIGTLLEAEDAHGVRLLLSLTPGEVGKVPFHSFDVGGRARSALATKFDSGGGWEASLPYWTRGDAH